MNGAGVPNSALPRAVEVLDRRPDLVGVLPLTDVLDQTARWSA